MHSTTDTTGTTTVATVAPLANTPAKATVRTRRATTALAKAKGTAVAKASKPAKPAKGTAPATAAAKANYSVVPLVVNPKRVAQALALLRSGSKPARAAGTMGCTVGQYAMQCMLGGTTPLGGTVPQHWYGSGKPGAPATPAALAKYVAGARAAGRSWGWLAAATRTTEGTVRAAYQCGTGQHHSTTGVGAWAHRNAR